MSLIPNFLLIGAGKSGTSSLHEYLNQHPEIFMSPVKEPMYFRYGYQKEPLKKAEKVYLKKIYDSKPRYLALFDGVENEKVVGESSTTYLANSYCASRIKQYNPRMKLLAVLRNPVDRAFSYYKMCVSWGIETVSFERAINEEVKGHRDDFPQIMKYLSLCKTAVSINEYKKHFSSDNFKIQLYEDMRKPKSFFQDLFQFLEVAPTYEINVSRKYNVSSEVPYNVFFNFLYQKLHRYPKIYPKALRTMFIPKFNEDFRAELVDLFSEDSRIIEDIIKRDLSHWYQQK